MAQCSTCGALGVGVRIWDVEFGMSKNNAEFEMSKNNGKNLKIFGE